MQSTVKADATNASIASDATPTSSSVNATNVGPFFMNGNMRFGGPRGMGRGFGGFGGPMIRGNQSFPMAPGFGSIQVSSAFIQNVTNIMNSSSDVQTLLSQGYNITSIRPVITTTINGNGNVVMQATSANVILTGPNGRALVVVSLTQAKVTRIVTTTINNNPT